MTTLTSELLTDGDNFKFEFEINIEKLDTQIEFIEQLIETFIVTFEKKLQVNAKRSRPKNNKNKK
ncbi:MAG: hypothetical protein LBD88_01765 [Candidatus Peribacteria bacterium]|nr:hypothetical protein [Candidatus Peribacteria bacterium]